MAPAWIVLPALLACFGPLVSAQLWPGCHAVLLPHPTDPNAFFTCKDGVPILQYCPPGMYFNNDLKACDSPSNLQCETGCSPLQNDVGGSWTPSTCSAGRKDLGSSCKLQCNQGFQLRGSSSVQCTQAGWYSVNGFAVPKCVPEKCIGGDINNNLKDVLSREAGILFVLDESGSVTLPNFQRTKSFVKDVIQKYPLNANRSAGIITFSTPARVHVNLNEESTSDFLKALDGIVYSAGGTNILGALQLALAEISINSKHPLTLVVLITDGESQTDGTPAANALKKAGHPLFAIGIDKHNNLVHLESLSSVGKNGIKHFFHITSYEALENIGKYL